MCLGMVFTLSLDGLACDSSLNAAVEHAHKGRKGLETSFFDGKHFLCQHFNHAKRRLAGQHAAKVLFLALYFSANDHLTLRIQQLVFKFPIAAACLPLLDRYDAVS